ncbi:MAG: Crp/Fnr family transcriptional regulator [Thermoleophilia bacterium]|nr:Crp/Fnr family transcriptional regulator [Thermoleophilia bacterium]
MAELTDQLKDFGIFAELDPEQIKRVASISCVREYPVGTQLTGEGQHADFLYLILAGKATVKVRHPDGGTGVLDEVGPGDELGWSVITPPYRYTATSEVTEPVRAIVIKGSDLRALAEQDHRLGYLVSQGALKIVARRYGRAIGSYEDLRAKDLRAFGGQERVIWDNGKVRLTTEAVLFEADTDTPDVIPLEAVHEVEVQEERLVLRAAGGDVCSPPVEHVQELASLVRDEVRRIRLAYRRVGS